MPVTPEGASVARSEDDLAEAVRAACLAAAVAAYEDAGIQGLCPEGRWEAAVAAIRRLDLPAAASTAPDSHLQGGGP